MLEALLVSSGVVALAEIGDKTQLLALVLAARYRRPVPIILGILVARFVEKNDGSACRSGQHMHDALAEVERAHERPHGSAVSAFASTTIDATGSSIVCSLNRERRGHLFVGVSTPSTRNVL